MVFKVLELYSGIGGMNFAWKRIPGQIIAAVDINEVANSVYMYNFPGSKVMTKNIQSLSVEEINEMDAQVLLMSPPCQPFTRNGKKLDLNDPRTASFVYILNILHQISSVKYILMENVKGFEVSEMRDMLVNKLKECDFHYQEFLLSPVSIGVPNSRLRYYIIGRKESDSRIFNSEDKLLEHIPGLKIPDPFKIEYILEKKTEGNFLVSEMILKRGKTLDICYKHSNRSCCFTKAYTHYANGTGSVYTDQEEEFVRKAYENANKYEPGSKEFIAALKILQLRFFTPYEVARLMAFPENFKFPDHITRKQKYRLLGNSVNVKVIAELIKLMMS